MTVHCDLSGPDTSNQRYYALGMDALVIVKHLQRACSCGLGMDALVNLCTWNLNIIMVRAWVINTVRIASGCEHKSHNYPGTSITKHVAQI